MTATAGRTPTLSSEGVSRSQSKPSPKQGTSQCLRQPRGRRPRLLSAPSNRATASPESSCCSRALAPEWPPWARSTRSRTPMLPRGLSRPGACSASSFSTGLFVLLASRPRHYAGVWELVIANKPQPRASYAVLSVGPSVHGAPAGAAPQPEPRSRCEASVGFRRNYGDAFSSLPVWKSHATDRLL